MGNKLTVYSNGITHVQKVVVIHGRTTVSIPVRKKYVADVLATVSVFGKVKLVEPPSYTNDASKNALTLDPSNVHFALVTKLSGAAVKVNQSGINYEGRLLGVHSEEVTSPNGASSVKYHVQIIDKSGVVRQFAQGTYASLEFTEPEVQRLIDTALSKNFESVRPDSVLVKLVLEPTEGNTVEARVEYATPTAAWQSIYQLRLGKTPILEYNAKIDNPTDEDWLDSKVSVVVGEPITLETTLGEVRTPSRSKVDLVEKKATGPIHAQTVMAMMKGGGRQKYSSSSMLRSGPETLMEDCEVEACYANNSFGGAAEVASATAEEVGDFAIFTSTDQIDVKAGLSGVVRLFNETVEADEVLFFDKTQDANRAYRGVRFRNTTSNSLGQGICTVYLGNTFAGQSEFKACKPGQKKTIVFARENGVGVHSTSESKNSRIAVGVKSGKMWVRSRQTTETTYKFNNLYKETGFEVEVDHNYSIDGGVDLAVTSGVKLEKTKTGVKLIANLPPNTDLSFTLTETKVIPQDWNVVGVNGLDSVLRIVGDDKKVIAELEQSASYKKVRKLVDERDSLQVEVGELNTKISELNRESASLKEEQERKLLLVQAGNAASQLSKWQGELDKNEDRLKELDTTLIPKANKDVKAKEKEVLAKGKEIEAAMREFLYESETL